MKIKSLGLKASLIVALVIAALIVVVLYLVSTQTSNLVMKITEEEARASNQAFLVEINTLQRDSATRATIVANLHEVINAILDGDASELKETLDILSEDMEILTLCDADGNVIMRTHSDLKGDNVLNQTGVRMALETGQGVGTIDTGTAISTIEAGTAAGLATRGTAAIRDYEGNIIGAVVCGHDLSDPKYVDEIKIRSNCEATIFYGDTRFSTTLIGDDGKRVIGTKASDAVVDKVINQRQDHPLQVELFGIHYYAYYSPLIVNNEVIGMLFTGVSIEEALHEQEAMFSMVLTAAVICGVVCIALVFLFNVFSVSRPLKKLGAFAEKIKSGDLGISSSTDSKTNVRSSDEVGVLARTLEQAYSQLRGYIGEINERMQELSVGNLRTESTYDFYGDFILIKDSINSIIRNLNQIMNEVNSSAAQVSSSAKQIADGSQLLAQGATEQAASIEELSSSIAEITAKTKTNASMAENAAILSDTIRGNAEKGTQQMDEMMAAVNDINLASQSIGKVIKVIDDIAFQTNILALNAAVEAARAGQHGKGFAVVAEEVRNLAAKSAEAARETGDMIQNSMQKAELGSRIAGETAVSLNEIVSGVNESGQIIGEIAKSSEEQSLRIEQINVGVDQVAQVVQQNSATAEESAAASEEMNGQSDMLQQLISQFELKDDREMLRSLPEAKKRN